MSELKEFCPNCEADVPCTHEAELYVCDICGEDFAQYIVSRNANVSDVSMTRDVTTPEPHMDCIIAQLENAVRMLADKLLVSPCNSRNPSVLREFDELEGEK